MPKHVANISVSAKLWRVKKRIQGLHIHKDAIKGEYWRGYQDALDHVNLLLGRMEYEERRKIAEAKDENRNSGIPG
jgi:hypothetical protein